ncbi:site-specific integrase [Streptomyces sp. TRM 70351]|uniref:tyrosine-type recombinase/integrase n=1 Tax=Streptomyces sp. TRM 70351 TaxID=3116552 RepID=UPI002E7BE231|nr:site-specific integrase [Streptomyces sp. TRM 70351]MEE1929460.1 site-specific integrase [Streptomyces sp. TRM 70351]
MAGHVQDRWYKTEPDANGKPRRVKTDRHGTGMRYRARYIGPDGTEKSKSFPDRQKRRAEDWLNAVEADMSRGQYTDPKTSRTTFQQYAGRWVAAHAGEVNSREAAERRLRLHAYPYFGSRPLGSFQPSHIRDWIAALETSVPAASHRRIIVGTVSAVLSAAVDDGVLSKNPCKARSVKLPRESPAPVVPWTLDQVDAVRTALPERFRVAVTVGAGCGMRQGEVFGLSLDELDHDGGWVAVRHQLKRIRGKYVFAPPKGGKVRDVPLPEAVSDALRAHLKRFPPIEVTLPWRTPEGPPVTRQLLLSGTRGLHVRVSHFNDHVWKPALVDAGVLPAREEGERYASAREHGMHALRHFYASLLLDAGENVRALSQYLGHSDPGFTLRTYTHLMPSSEGRTRQAVDNLFQRPRNHDHGPETAQGDEHPLAE